MKINFSMDVRQTQKLQITKELKQAIEMLNMNNQEVESIITEEVRENPVLEIESKEEIDWSKFANDMKNVVTHQSKSYVEDEDNESNPENYIQAPVNIYDYLEKEISSLKLDASEKEIAYYIIERVNDSGYFTASIEEAVTLLGIDEEAFINVLKKVQNIEPTGICARNLKECLLLQLAKHYEKDDIVIKLVENELENIAAKKYQLIQKKYKLKEEELADSIKIIKSLDPKPGRGFTSFSPMYVFPDVNVEKIGNNWEVTSNSTLPHLYVSEFYRKLLSERVDEVDKDTEKYIKEKLNKAVNLIKNIEQRKNTIHKVATKIIENQIDFFEKGKSCIVPMKLKDIADVTGFHESTISRAVNGKYMMTPRGLFEFKYFFTTSVSTSDGLSISNKNIKDKIKEIIDDENKKKPLSDQKICDILNDEGIEVSRRTVAKYREELQLLTSSLRREI
ncbi:RNA polymerase factor sigma-54 [Proteocatella sphenisci]|uniref:RNA polymerase factor sigma-54 n=1 Tax=Proteocatella sphenisci TaxID=181070 RepID=UPI00048C0574|nr:RNA polymerase factor sigma-54 [Proteocatella sphenisci]